MIKNSKVKIKPYNQHIRTWWRVMLLAAAMLAVGLLTGSCGAQKEVPVKTETIIRDSIIYKERIDTTWITLPPVYIKDYTALRDTLHLSSPYAVAWAAVDEGKELLVGAIESTDKQIPVHTLEVEKVIKKDTLIYQDRPYYIDRPVKYIPKFHKVFSTLGIIWTLLFLVLVYLKIRKIL